MQNTQDRLTALLRIAFRTHPAGGRQVLLAGAAGLFVTAAAIGMAPDTIDPADIPVQRIVEQLPLPALEQQIEALAEAQPALFVREERVQRGDSVASLLARLGISDPALISFLRQSADTRSLYQLRPGRILQAASDADGSVHWLRYVHTPAADEDGKTVTRLLHVQRTDQGFQAQEKAVAAERELRVGYGEIRHSLFGATDAAEIPDPVALQMAEILGSNIDFHRDLRRGDTFRVVYESFRHQGEYVRSGRILALEFVNKGKTYEAFWFAPADGSQGGYYDSDGESLRRAFLRSPMEFSRVTSGFSMRFHPLHREWRQHNGVDYAAPIGTPARITGDGEVEFVGVQRGYGNVVIVRHSGGYRTLYGHLSSFGEGIRRGARVTQGQHVGNVGCTGWCTGPHLHYEFHVNGQPVNPLTIALPGSPPLERAKLAEFKTQSHPWIDMLGLLARLQSPAQPGTEVASQ